MTQHEQKKKEPKVDETKEQLEATAVSLAKQDSTLTIEIEKLTETRTKLRKERRAIEGKLITIHTNERAEGMRSSDR